MDKERERQIVDAFLRCVRERGLESTTLDDVSRATGLRRGTVRHFVGNRRDLIHLAVDRLLEIYEREYRAAIANVSDPDQVAGLLNVLFVQEVENLSDEDRAIEALLGVATWDPELRTRLRRMYEIYEKHVLEVLAGAFPKKPRASLEQVAYAIVCLAEQNNDFLALGFPKERCTWAHRAATVLVSSLDGERASNYEHSRT